MAWEWVAPVAGSAVGVAGIVGTVVATAKGQRHNERVADKRNAHERGLAEDARRQQRLADAYVELLEMVHTTGAWSEAVRPLWDSNPPRPLPPLPDLSQQTRVLALADAFASTTARELVKEWREAVGAIIRADQDIEWAMEHDGDSPADPLLALRNELRPAERRVREELANQIAAELGHRDAT